MASKKLSINTVLVALRFLPDMIRYHKVLFLRFCKRSEASEGSSEQTVINLTATFVMIELMFFSVIVFPNRFPTISGE